MMRLRSLCTLGLALFALCAGAAPASLEVSYLTADRVYLDGGDRQGLAAGDRLEVAREGRHVATLEVVYAATHSASCRVLDAVSDVRVGDRVVLGEPTAARPVLAARGTPGASAGAVVSGQQESPRVESPERAEPPPPAYTRSEPTARPLRSSVSGSLSFDWEQFTDNSGYGRDYDRTAARLSLRGRNLGGLPLQFQMRSSTRNLDRVVSSDGSSITETRDRLYELSLAYEPPEGRFALRLGRLRLGRYAGAGTIDGISAETRFGRIFHLGVFGGSRSDISDFGYDGDRTSYGITSRWTAGSPGRVRELLLAAVREDGVIDVSREYVALQTRVAGSRWSFYQRAEFDVNNGWRQELSGRASQLSTLFVNASARVSDRSRFSLSYSQFQRYRTEETRFIPEELFDENLRQGLRARWTIGKPSGFNVTLSGGVRERDGDVDNATSAGLGVRHNNLFGRRYSVGIDLLNFSNAFSDGNTAILSSAKRFKGGHQISLTAGARRLNDLLRDGETRQTQWFRIGGWFELPGNLFARTELEASSGDEIEGRRILVGLGYRL
jgi:hypothetical protein